MSGVVDDEIIKFFCTHFVSLGVEFCPLDSKGKFDLALLATERKGLKNDIVCCSGFVMETGGHWFLVTAGHILESIDKLVRAGNVGILQTHVIDHFGPNAPHQTLIPIDYADTPKYCENDQAAGTDFAFIHLRDLIQANLRQNNVVPVDRTMWANEVAPAFDLYFTLGLPTELFKHLISDRKPGREARIDFRVAMIPVQKLDDLPADLPKHSEPLFVGRIPPEQCGIVDIDGMSGGHAMDLVHHANGSTGKTRSGTRA
jgi:hypothetical protein